MKLCEINPYVRYVHWIDLIPEFTSCRQTAYDQRLFFCVKGKCEISVLDKKYFLSENSLLFVPSGTAYILHKSEEKVLLAGINFDFTFIHSDSITPIVPARQVFVKEKQFENILFSDGEVFNTVYFTEKQNHLYPYIKNMFDEYDSKLLFFSEKCSSLLKFVLTDIARNALSAPLSSTGKTVQAVIGYIQSHFGEDISNGSIGDELNFHPNYLNRIMILHTGKSLHRYLMEYRLKNAIDMLQFTSLSISQIAEKCGFSDISRFSKFFKSETGYTPSSFR